jgi:hypothetical protein
VIARFNPIKIFGSRCGEPGRLPENSLKRSNSMRRRLKNGVVNTRGNEGTCPLVYSRTGFQTDCLKTQDEHEVHPSDKHFSENMISKISHFHLFYMMVFLNRLEEFHVFVF